MNNKEYPLHMVKIVVRATKALEHMQIYVKENRISQISFTEYFSLLNASVIIKQGDIYNQIIQELNELILSIKGNLGR